MGGGGGGGGGRGSVIPDRRLCQIENGLTLIMLGKKFNRRHFVTCFFLIFLEKGVCHYMIFVNCLRHTIVYTP